MCIRDRIETITTTHSPEDACQQPYEAEGSQGSWQMQRKIGQRLRGARGATWLERFASLTAGAILNSIAAIGGPC